jgi:hypothetical protein
MEAAAFLLRRGGGTITAAELAHTVHFRKADMPLLQPVLQSRIDAILSHVDDVVPIESIGAWLQESPFSRVWVFDRFMGKLEAVIP